jgi:DNA polymerase-1
LAAPGPPAKKAAVDYGAYRLVDGEPAWEELMAAVGRARSLAVDLETDKLKPSEAAIVGVALATDAEGEAFYVPVAHETPGAPNQPWSLVADRIGPFLAAPEPKKIAQHAKFDWQILARRGLVLPVPADDPMLASYLLDPDARHGLDAMSLRELGHEAISFKSVVPDPKKTFASVDPDAARRYAAEDADLAMRLASVLRRRLSADRELMRLYEEVELPLEELLGRMEGLGVLVDPEALRALSGELEGLMAERAAKIYSLIGRPLNLASPRQLSEALFVEMGLPSGKKTAKKTGLSTDNEVLTELAPLYPVAAEIIAWRELAKLKSTYADKLPEAINPLTGRVHTSYNQALTATGRLSSSDPNLQNIPARTEEGRRVRAAFKAPPGWRLISADYSQIELRVMAHFSGDPELLRAFAEDEDVHAQTAARIFGLPLGQVPPEKRREAKTINFGIIYGQGPYGLAKQLGIPQTAAKAIIDSYFQRFPGVKAYMAGTMARAEAEGLVRTWFGRVRRLPLIKAGGQSKREAQRMAVNTPVQGTAADIIKMAMIMVDGALRERGLRARIIMQVHDELVLEAPVEEVEAVRALVKERMELAGREPLAGGRPLAAPLKADVADGEAWVHA